MMVLFISAIATFRVTKNEFNDKIKLDITLEQMIESEKKINNFFKVNNINSNISVDRIADILNVKQGGVEQGIHGQACLKEDTYTGEKFVMFKNGLSESEKIFAFAHEIAHILNGDGIPVMRPNGRNKSQVEQLADYTAAALLMPSDSVFDFLTRNDYKGASAKKRMILVRQLCKKYKMTEMVVLRRIKEVYALKG